MKKNYIFVAVLAVLSAVAIGAQLLLSGPVKADKELGERIRLANEQIQQYYGRNDRLPSGLSDISGDKAGIEYRVLTSDTYELCGTFQTQNLRKNSSASEDVPTSYIDTTQHMRGHHCYQGASPIYNGGPAKRIE